MPTLTYTTQLIFSSKEDEQKLRQTLEAERLCFNMCSELHFGTPRNSIVELHAKAYRKIRDLHPEIPAQIVIIAERQCLAAYITVKSNKHKLKTSIKKKGLSLQLDDRVHLFKNGLFRITTVDKRIEVDFYKYPKLQELLSKHKFSSPKLFERNGQICIALPFKIPEPVVQDGEACGVDLGINRYAATSEGKIFQDKKYNGDKRKLRYLKRCLQSKGTKSAKKHLFRIRHKERNRSKELCHQLANKIIQSTECNTIVIEDLSKIKDKQKRGIPKYRKINKLSQVPFYLIRFILTYKALLHGKQVITVNPSFTSQIDHQTGYKSGERKGCRYYAVKGRVYDADINAAINIALRSKLPVSFARELDGQALVIAPIVGTTLI